MRFILVKTLWTSSNLRYSNRREMQEFDRLHPVGLPWQCLFLCAYNHQIDIFFIFPVCIDFFLLIFITLLFYQTKNNYSVFLLLSKNYEHLGKKNTAFAFSFCFDACLYTGLCIWIFPRRNVIKPESTRTDVENTSDTTLDTK